MTTRWTKWKNPLNNYDETNTSNIKYKFNRPTFIKTTIISIYNFFKHLIVTTSWYRDRNSSNDVDDQELLYSTHAESHGDFNTHRSSSTTRANDEESVTRV